MSARITRRGVLAGLLGAAAVPALANAPARSLRPVLRPATLGLPTPPAGAELVARARLDARVAYSVADAGSGQMLESRDSKVPLPPASVAKALSALYALEVLGPQHRFVTRLVATGPVEDGKLKGDLVLAGGGDPTLDTDGLAALAEGLKEAGVREVTGAFRVWGGALPFVPTIDVEQPDHVGYSPAVSGLNLNFNRVHFEWARKGGEWDITMDAPTVKHQPDVTMATMEVKDRRAPVYTYTDEPGRDVWTVAEWALGNGGGRWLPVRKPELYAGEVLQILVRSHGIVLKDAELAETEPEGDVLASFESAPLRQILEDMLYHSTNITAECVGMSASRARDPGVATLRESAAAMNDWFSAEFGVSGIALVDHSGLGGDSDVTSNAMVRVLATERARSRLHPILKDITMRDSQRRPVRDHPLDVKAKTGTLNFVSGLAGYLTGPDGTVLAFAIFAADVPRREALSEAERERPPGARSWNGRAKILQQALLDRWGYLHATEIPASQ